MGFYYKRGGKGLMKRILGIFLMAVLCTVFVGCEQIPEFEQNNAPIVEGEAKITLSLNSAEPDWASLITVTDEEDGAIRVVESMIDSNVDFSKVGVYEVKFYIVDSDNKTTLYTLEVEIIDDREITFSLLGESEITIEVHNSFEDPGVVALDLDGLESEYTVYGTVDTSVTGVYTLAYSMEDYETTLVRNVTVVDTTPPVIIMDTVNLIKGVYTDQSWLEHMNSVTDNYSDEITIEVTENTIDYSQEGAYSITIKATDEAGNEATSSFNVVVTEVTLFINGDSVIEQEVNQEYNDLGAVAFDSESNPLTLTTENNVDMTTLGTYTVVYEIEGMSGLSITRTVEVVDTTAPVMIIEDQAIAYTTQGVDWTKKLVNVTDNYDSVVSVLEYEDNVEYGTPGEYTVILEAIDSSGNRSVLTVNVTVNDSLINVLEELPSEEIMIEFWHIYGASKSALLDQMIAEFEQLYPNINVESSSKGTYTDLQEATEKAIQAGTTPNLILGYPINLNTYKNYGELVPLIDFINDDTWGLDLTDFLPSYIEESRQLGDEMYSMPFSKATEVLIYNKSILEANGYFFEENEVLTWEQLEDIADSVVGTGENQCEFLINFDSQANFFINSSNQWDAGYTGPSGQILVDNQNTREMLQYYNGLIESNILAFPIEWEQSYGSTNFLAKDTCMTVGSTAGVRYNNPNYLSDPEQQFEVGVLPVPQFGGQTESAIQQGPNIGILDNSTDAQRLASWLLIKYLTNTENTAKWAVETGYQPVRLSGYETVFYQEFLQNLDGDRALESDAASAAYSQMGSYYFENAFEDIGVVSSLEARNTVQDAMESFYLGNMTVEETVTYIHTQLNDFWNVLEVEGNSSAFISYQGQLEVTLDAYSEFVPMSVVLTIGNETFEMTTSSVVDTGIVGDQTVIYSYTDSANNQYSLSQTIHIESNMNTIYELKSSEMIEGDSVAIKGIIVGVVRGYGYHLYDGTGYTFVYQGQDPEHSIGDEVVVFGEKGLYNMVVQVINITNTTLISSGNLLPDFTPITLMELYQNDYDDNTIYGETINISGFLTLQGEYNNIYLSWYDENLELQQVQVYYRSEATKIEELEELQGKLVNIDCILYDYYAGNLGIYRLVVNETGSITEMNLTDEDLARLTLAFTTVTMEESETISGDIELPILSQYTNGSIVWTSSNEAILSSTGVYNNTTGVDQEITLTATVTIDTVTVTKEYHVIVTSIIE